MVNQNIEQLLQQAVDQSMAQTQESRELADDVSGLIGEIRNEVEQAVQRTDDAIGRVDTAIPTAVNDEMYRHLYLDPTNGDDSNTGHNLENAFKTLKTLIEAAPVGGTVVVRGAHDTVINIDEEIVSLNKHIVIMMNDCTLNINARIQLYFGSFKNYYPFREINQTVDTGFLHFSSDIRVAGTINPSGEAQSLLKQTYTSGHLSYPGSHHSNVLFEGTVNDATSQYYVFSPKYYKASMVVVTYAVTLGANVDLFDPIYNTVQVGTKGVYLVGA